MSDESVSENQVPVPARISYEDISDIHPYKVYSGPLRLRNLNMVWEATGHIEISLANYGVFRVAFNRKQTRLPQADEALANGPIHCSIDQPPLLRDNDFIVNLDPSHEESSSIRPPGITLQKKKATSGFESPAALEFALINYHEIYREEDESSDDVSDIGENDVFAFPFGEYTVTIFPLLSAHSESNINFESERYVLTHRVTVSRSDKNLFKNENVTELLEALYWYFSLTAGRRIAPYLPIGYQGKHTVVWQQWNSYAASPNGLAFSWFDPNTPTMCFKTSTAFYRLWKDSSKRKWLQTAVATYCFCNRNQDAIEYSHAEALTLLELLCSVALMEENSLMAEETFDKLPAADRISALLFWMNLDKSVPEELGHLCDIIKDPSGPTKIAKKDIDGPNVITAIRNLIIHPSRSNRADRDKVSNQVIYEAWQLSLWYCELALLKLLGYSGHYNSRFHNHPFPQDICVPWTVHPTSIPNTE